MINEGERPGGHWMNSDPSINYDESTSDNLANHIGLDGSAFPEWAETTQGKYAFRHAGGSANFLYMDGHANAKLPKTDVAASAGSQSPDDIAARWRWQISSKLDD